MTLTMTRETALVSVRRALEGSTTEVLLVRVTDAQVNVWN